MSRFLVAGQVATSLTVANSVRRVEPRRAGVGRSRVRAALDRLVGRRSSHDLPAPAPARSTVTTRAGGGLARHVVGAHERVPTLSGESVRYVNLDNAATTPAMHVAIDAVEAALPRYGSVHRGAGYNARCSTEAYERSRAAVGAFVGADSELDTVVFTKNTTEAINMLAHSMTLGDDAVVLTTVLEHHSNDLPWRARLPTHHVGARPDGSLDLDDLDRLLTAFSGRVALLVVSGASNVTGVTPPIHDIARRVHRAGGRVLVDAAQLAPHRPIDMRPHDDPEHLDFVVLSAHKLYAPFGSGALIGARSCFGAAPDHRGGGTVDAVTLDEIVWTDLPYRQEAGTPNLIGAVALAAAVERLGEIGWDAIVDHERALQRRCLDGLSRIPSVRVYGPNDAGATIGVIPFTIDGVAPGLVAAILGYEHGIGVRSGCFCAHPYISHLLGLDGSASRRWAERARNGDRLDLPGLVRISFGFYNDESDVDRVLDAVARIAAGEVAGVYRSDAHGDYHPIEPSRLEHGSPAIALTA